MCNEKASLWSLDCSRWGFSPKRQTVSCFTHSCIIGTLHSSEHMRHIVPAGQPVRSSDHTAPDGQPVRSTLPNSGSTGPSPVLTLGGGQIMAGSLVGQSTFMKSNKRGSHLVGERPMASGSPSTVKGKATALDTALSGPNTEAEPANSSTGHRTCAGEFSSPHEIGCKLPGASDLIEVAEGIVT